MSIDIDIELIVQILKRSPQGLTPFEILNHLINEPQYQGFSRSIIFSKLRSKLIELRDLQTLVHIPPRWLLIESTDDMCEPDVLVESSSHSDCPDKLEPFQNLEPSIDESTEFNSANQTLSDDALVVFSDWSIEVLKLSVRTYNCLKTKNINTIRELQNYSDIDLMNIKNFGQKSLDELKMVLSKVEIQEQFVKPELEMSPVSLPSWFRLSALQIPTNNLLQTVRNSSPLSLSPLIRQLSNSYPTIAHLIFAFELEEISLNLHQRAELARIINPFRILCNAPQPYLNWLECLPDSTIIDILAKRLWTPDKLKEVYPWLILSVTPHDFRQTIFQEIVVGNLPSNYCLTIADEVNSIFDSNQAKSDLLKQRLGLQDGVIRTLEEIGQKLNLTRERIRQITNREEKKIRYFKANLGIGFLPQLFHVSKMSLHSAGSIITLQNWTEEIEKSYPAGDIHLPSVIVWFVSFISEIHTLETSNPHLFYTSPISNQTLTNIQSQLSEFWEEQKISDRSQLHQVILPLLPENIENPEKAANTLISVFCQEPLPNVFSNKKWNMTDYAYYALHESGKPLHFTEISNRIKQLKPDWKATNIERSGQGLIERHRDIIRSGSGIYGLRDWGTMEYTHFREVLLDYLSKQTLPVNAEIIHADVSQVYAASLPTVKMTLNFHLHLFQKFGRSNFYGLKGRHYELPNQTLIDLLVANLEVAPASLVELEENSDFTEYSRDTIYLYLSVSPLFLDFRLKRRKERQEVNVTNCQKSNDQ